MSVVAISKLVDDNTEFPLWKLPFSGNDEIAWSNTADNTGDGSTPNLAKKTVTGFGRIEELVSIYKVSFIE